MEDPFGDINYEYNINVRDKVKRLEASLNNSNSSTPQLSPKNPKRKTNGTISKQNGHSHINTSIESIPAVMDVEQSQMPIQILDSNNTQTTRAVTPTPLPLLKKPLTHLKLVIPPVKYNQDKKDLESPSTPKDVKSLLKKFTNGVSNTMRRMSSGTVDVKGVCEAPPVPQYSSTSSLSSQNEDPSSNAMLDEVHQTQVIKETNSFRKSLSIPSLFRNRRGSEGGEQNIRGLEKLRSAKSQFSLDGEENDSKTSLENHQSVFAKKDSKLEKIDCSKSVQTLKKTFEQNSSKINPEVVSNGHLTEECFKPQPKPRNVLLTQNNNVQSEDQFTKKEIIASASVLVIGQGRAGKSSLINHLLRQDILTIRRGNRQPTSPEIVEILAKVENGSSLKIIDVPGFTTNDDHNASLISTLLSYIESSEGLQNKIPTTAFIVLRCESDEEDLSETEEEVINFFKIVSHYRNELLNLGNIIFVLTHIPPEAMEETENITLELSNAIRQYLSPDFEEKIQIAFHQPSLLNDDLNNNSPEQKAKDLVQSLSDLVQKENLKEKSVEWTTLYSAFGPNYPKSIIDCYILKRLPLKNSTHPDALKVQKTIRNLLTQGVPIERTEISLLLEIGWENVDAQLRQKYPSSLPTLQQMFQKLQIRNFNDLPEEHLKVLSILNHIPHHNPVVTDLLNETLQLRVPSCYPALYIGQGFDVSKDQITHVSPFQFTGGLKTSPVGLIPEEIGCKLTDDREIIFKFFVSNEDYVLDRFKDLSIEYVIFPRNNPPMTINDQRIGYNVIKPNQEPSKSTTATALIEHRVFQLSLCRGEDLEFKPQFWEMISSLPELDIKKSDTVEAWKEFFKYWGTHIVKTAFGGGSIQVNFRGKMLSKIYKSLKQDSILPIDEFETSEVFQWITGDGLNFAASAKPDSKSEFLQGFDVDTSFQGGDMKLKQIDLIKLDFEKVAEIREEWIKSLPLNPIMLESNLVLVPISFFVRKKSEGIATKMDIAFHHFYANFMALQGKHASCLIL